MKVYHKISVFNIFTNILNIRITHIGAFQQIAVVSIFIIKNMTSQEVQLKKYKPLNKSLPVLAAHYIKVDSSLTYLFLSLQTGMLEIVGVKNYQFKFIKSFKFTQIKELSYEVESSGVILYLLTVEGTIYKSILDSFINGLKPKEITKVQNNEDDPILRLATWKKKNTELEMCIFKKKKMYLYTKKKLSKQIQLPISLRQIAIQMQNGSQYKKIALFFQDNKYPIVIAENEFTQSLINQQQITEANWLSKLSKMFKMRDEYLLEDQQISQQIKEVRICNKRMLIATQNMFSSFSIERIQIKPDESMCMIEKIFSIRLNSPFICLTTFPKKSTAVITTKQRIQTINYQQKARLGHSIKQNQKKIFDFVAPYTISYTHMTLILSPIASKISNSVYLVSKKFNV